MRRNAGKETWHTLVDWDREQASAERMAAQIVLIEGFKSIDPSHPLGGPDGLKDIICERDGVKYVAAAYFPRGQKIVTEIKQKFTHDLEGVSRNNATGFIFITNQELTLGERDQLQKLAEATIKVEIYHLERLASILNSPQCYGIRLDFLDIEMTKEEQLAFIAYRDNQVSIFIEEQRTILKKIDEIILNLKEQTNADTDTLLKLKKFRDILNQISGDNYLNYSYFSTGHVSKLSVPLAELLEFKKLLDGITDQSFMWPSNKGKISSLKVPLQELIEFSDLLTSITTSSTTGYSTDLIMYSPKNNYGKISELKIPLSDLQEYENTLNRVLVKLREKRDLENNSKS